MRNARVFALLWDFAHVIGMLGLGMSRLGAQ